MKLIETMHAGEYGAIRRLDRHLSRLAASASFFSFPFNRASIEAALRRHARPGRIRLLLSGDGAVEIKVEPLSLYPQPTFLVISTVCVDSADPFVRHKTTNRNVYDRARAVAPPGGDVLMMNERGEVTETPIANVALKRNGLWITPPLSCGLLAGTMRAELLEKGALVEGVLRAADVADGEIVRCFNSVREVFDLPFRQPLKSNVLRFSF